MLAPTRGAQYIGTVPLIVTAFRDLGEVQLELDTRARVESIARGLPRPTSRWRNCATEIPACSASDFRDSPRL